MAGPQQGASENSKNSWIASPRAARAVRVLVFLLPVIGAWVAVRMLAQFYFQPLGWIGIVVWALQALLTGAIAATAVDRFTRRALPLATLLGMTLTFPDQAPSRFSVAIRTGTVRQMKKRLEELAEHGLADDVQKASEQAIELVTLLGRHERLTRGHTERVRAYADVIAGEMSLAVHDRQMLSWGVLLHDIGKLSVPPEILNKNGRPTEEEWAILQTHPAEGARILAPLAGWLGDWALAASEHHERWDGNGYPKGLSGRGISLAGRITAVADAYDVITSRRSYKAPMSIESARQELVRCSKTQFDPAVVRAMLGASIDERTRVGRLLGWIPEIPGLATVSNAIALIPPAVVATALATTGAVAASPARPVQELALVEPEPPVSTNEQSPTTTSTSTVPDLADAPMDGSTSTNGSTTLPPTTLPLITPPSTTLPSTTLPPTTLPGVSIPGISIPGVSLPGVSLPGVSLPGVSLPGVSLPGVSIPGVSLPGVSVPDVTVPAGELTDGLLGGAETEVTVPTLPPVTVLDLGLGGFGFRSVTPSSSTTTAATAD